MTHDDIYKAWQTVGADVAGLKWGDFVKALAEQPRVRDKSGTDYEKLHAKWRKGRQELANLTRAHEALLAKVRAEQPAPVQQEPVVTDWECVARAQNAKLMAMCNQPGGMDKLREVLLAAAPQPARPALACAQIVSLNDMQGVVKWLPHNGALLNVGDKLYTTPQAQQPLTDEQWQVIADTLHCCISRDQKDTIEAALGITSAPQLKENK